MRPGSGLAGGEIGGGHSGTGRSGAGLSGKYLGMCYLLVSSKTVMKITGYEGPTDQETNR